MPSEQPREGTRVNPDDVERAERWIGDAISRYYDHGCDDEADRDVMAMRRCIDALKARLEPAQPQPREGTRVKVVFTRAEAEALLLASDGYFSPDATNLGLGANKIAAALEPASPTPTEQENDR